MSLSPARLFALPSRFVMGASAPDGLPAAKLPEIAFLGRSNVGKSSLLNALTGRRGLARASNTPGRTREINFFELEKTLMLVDLPGYGFAKASHAERDRWGRLVMAYLVDRANLRRALLLIDARHGLKDSDEMMLEMLDEAGVSTMLVLTKSDKVKAAALTGIIAETAAASSCHPSVFPAIIATSAEKKTGMKQLRAALAAAIT